MGDEMKSPQIKLIIINGTSQIMMKLCVRTYWNSFFYEKYCLRLHYMYIMVKLQLKTSDNNDNCDI
jgi:hypothetical protein